MHFLNTAAHIQHSAAAELVLAPYSGEPHIILPVSEPARELELPRDNLTTPLHPGAEPPPTSTAAAMVFSPRIASSEQELVTDRPLNIPAVLSAQLSHTIFLVNQSGMACFRIYQP